MSNILDSTSSSQVRVMSENIHDFSQQSMQVIQNGYFQSLATSPKFLLRIQKADNKKWNQVNPIQKSQPLVYDGFTGAFASFFQTWRFQIAHKLTNEVEPGVPENWQTGE
jgi:hypothetical protein